MLVCTSSVLEEKSEQSIQCVMFIILFRCFTSILFVFLCYIAAFCVGHERIERRMRFHLVAPLAPI